MAEIYLPYVRDTAISFETTPPDAEEMRSRITTTLAYLPWLVVADDECVKGFAYASPHRAREAYRWSADVSLYLDESMHRQGMAAGSTPRCSMCLSRRATSTPTRVSRYPIPAA